MFSLAAIDRTERSALNRAARCAHGLSMGGFRSVDEARVLTRRHGLSDSLLGGGRDLTQEALASLMESSKCCAWCRKSLGQKRTALFMHRDLLGWGGSTDMSNVVVSCQQCARARQDGLLHDPGLLAVERSRTRPSGPMASAATLDELALQSFHGEWVYVAPGRDRHPWVFLAYGASGFTFRMQHIKHAYTASEATFMLADDPLGEFRGLVVKRSDIAERILRDIQRAGKVEVLPG